MLYYQNNATTDLPKSGKTNSVTACMEPGIMIEGLADSRGPRQLRNDYAYSQIDHRQVIKNLSHSQLDHRDCRSVYLFLLWRVRWQWIPFYWKENAFECRVAHWSLEAPQKRLHLPAMEESQWNNHPVPSEPLRTLWPQSSQHSMKSRKWREKGVEWTTTRQCFKEPWKTIVWSS